MFVARYMARLHALDEFAFGQSHELIDQIPIPLTI